MLASNAGCRTLPTSFTAQHTPNQKATTRTHRPGTPRSDVNERLRRLAPNPSIARCWAAKPAPYQSLVPPSRIGGGRSLYTGRNASPLPFELMDDEGGLWLDGSVSVGGRLQGHQVGAGG